MSRTLTAADRSALIRLASTMPAGSEERRAILAGLRTASHKIALRREVVFEASDRRVLYDAIKSVVRPSRVERFMSDLPGRSIDAIITPRLSWSEMSKIHSRLERAWGEKLDMRASGARPPKVDFNPHDSEHTIVTFTLR